MFHTAFQPLVRVPFMGDCIGVLVDYLLKHKAALASARTVMAPSLSIILPLYARLFGSPLQRKLQPPGAKCYLLTFFESYFGTLCESPQVSLPSVLWRVAKVLRPYPSQPSEELDTDHGVVSCHSHYCMPTTACPARTWKRGSVCFKS